jgi:hypothetical protein
MNITKDQIFTPNKKNLILDEIKSEVAQVKNAISSTPNGSGQQSLLNANLIKLQDLLNGILSKKGVITPDETNNTIDVISQSKKDRLARDYVMGATKTTIYLLGAIVVGFGIYWYVKKRKQ